MPSLQLTRALRRASAACLAATVIGAALASPVAAAATTLSNPKVAPANGTTASVFAFSVRVVASNPVAVRADVSDGTTVQLAVVSGTAVNGTYRGSASLPAGTWTVTFIADGPGGGSNDDSIDLPAPITVLQGGTPPPTPSPTPTATPTPTPTLRPTPMVRPTAGPTPRPGTPGPTPTPPPTPAPGATPLESGPSASPSGDGDTDPTTTPAGSALTSAPSTTDGASAIPSATIAPSRSEEPGGLGPLPWVVLGATMAGSGAVVLGVQLARRRMRARIG